MEIHKHKSRWIRFRKRNKKGTYEKSNGSIKIRNRKLKSVACAGAQMVTKELDGGEEVRESVDLIIATASPVINISPKGASLYRKKKSDRKMIKDTRCKEPERQNKYERITRVTKVKTEKTAKTGKKAKTYNKNTGNKKQQNASNGTNEFIKSRMLERFLEKFHLKQSEEEKEKNRIAFFTQKLTMAAMPVILGLVGVVTFTGVILVTILSVIYNSPFAIFFPMPDTGYENPRTVLSEYYKEFNQDIVELENHGYVITYQNAESGIPVSNYNDTLMVYMVKYGTGQSGVVMDEQGKENLKKVFDEMNYYDLSSSSVKLPAGESLGDVVTTGYCSCSICCGVYAGGSTASGTKPKAKHTIAVDAYNPIVPMGTKVVMDGITYTVEDTGNLNAHGTDFDIYFASHQDALKWGKRKVEAFLAEEKENTVEVTTSGTTVHNLTYEDYMALDNLSEEKEKLLAELMSDASLEMYYENAKGQAVVDLARTKLGCKYDQGRRMEEGYYDGI